MLAVNKALQEAQQEIVPRAQTRARATVAQDRPLTVNTIQTKAYKKGTDVIVEIRAKGAALFLEFGTSKMPPKPFMFTALKASQDPYMELLADIGEKVLAGDL
jgi:HK97 gp10 family phage protein